MSTEINLSEVKLRKIDSIEKHLYQEFQCERQELNEFLVEDALSYHEHGLTKTSLVFYNDDLVGYFSISADRIELTPTEKDELYINDDIQITYFPAIKITKLAVDLKYARLGVGSYLIDLIEGMAFGLEMGIRFITLDAVNKPEVLDFYRKNGFQESLHEERQRRQQKNRPTILMHKDIFAE
ncbi:TPA: GNAT family N-acetyltransferase [Acinetobacter baumannii]|nr:GNAT family N-acetyltransferase [Acinetobacter baumannii]HAV5593296.1 GNAT family N-acetyltransferase [Acinetobacter baumannii]